SSSLTLYSTDRDPTLFSLFLLHAPPPTQTYTLSLHDALPISAVRDDGHAVVHLLSRSGRHRHRHGPLRQGRRHHRDAAHRNSGRSEEPRLNSSHLGISYAVFCLKKKKKINITSSYNESELMQS